MAIANSTTNTDREMSCKSSAFDLEINTLLNKPLSASMDLFQILEVCENLVDVLIENVSPTEEMALCGRLLAAMDVLKVVLRAPLPVELVEILTVDAKEASRYLTLFSTDSETMCNYCITLVMLLLNQQGSLTQKKQITGMLFELFNVLAGDLKLPRFVRTDTGLSMIGGSALPVNH